MRRLCLALLLLAVAAPAAHAFRLPVEAFAPVAGNPANRLVTTPIDAIEYDAARRCDPKVKPGTVAFTRWLQRNAHGVYWGSYRCERWGKGSASLHAENRAVDWHLDAYDQAERVHAATLIALMLAPDTAGNPHALARRMGVEEIIWDCSYWGAGMTDFKKYSPCFRRDGRPRKGVDRTTAHRDHIHFGLSKAGAAGRTTFWQVG
ncbi:MAG TPA: hypothetical protein VGW75_13435 [Solirubrobacteraceae bacterium]|jgi:hypothetical protein|nr:hypothetical protein [Solirubrobacteraceae bacterium]